MKNAFFGKSKTVFLVFFAASCAFCFFSPSVYSQSGNEYKSRRAAEIPDDFAADAIAIFNLVNAERTKRGLSALVSDDKVSDVARDYSKKMARENFFSHFDFDGNSVLERAKAARLKHWSRIGENLFSVENLAVFDRFAVRNWMKSPAHRLNILDREWTATGVGVAKSKDGEIFITQIFIKR